MKQKKILIVRSNACSPDPRVEKEAMSLSKIAKIEIIAWDREGLNKKHENLGHASISRLRLKAPYGNSFLILLLPIWFSYVFFKILFKDFDVIHACDFDTVLPSYLVAKLRRKMIVYDIFDFYADTLPFSQKSFFYQIIKQVDIWIINRVDCVILVDHSRIEQIIPAQPKRIIYIYNSPSRSNASNTKNKERMKFTVFYAGVLSLSRGLDTLIKASQNISGLRLLIAGFGEDATYLKRLCHESNVSFLGKIPYKKVIELTAQSDCLIATYDPRIKNHRYSSPNKLFEAMALGKPIIVAKNTGMDQTVRKEKMGIVVNYGNQSQLTRALQNLLNNRELSRRLSHNSSRAYLSYNWETMEKRLIDSYNNLFSNN